MPVASNNREALNFQIQKTGLTGLQRVKLPEKWPVKSMVMLPRKIRQGNYSEYLIAIALLFNFIPSLWPAIWLKLLYRIVLIQAS